MVVMKKSGIFLKAIDLSARLADSPKKPNFGLLKIKLYR